ncbi:MAG: hypothetical protein K1X72_27355 [Pyrinomonadaceae bacterium]|nr:hypothetical protein [Pyrinomonadaceae bacterium]
MKKRPNLILREPVKLYEPKILEKELPPQKEKKLGKDEEFESKQNNLQLAKKEIENTILEKEKIEFFPKRISLREKMSPRVQQIWDYFCQKAKQGDEFKKSFCLTRAEVMKGAGIGSTNTYRDALKKFQDLDLLKIELRPGVNSGSVFTFTERGIEELG